MSAKRQSSFGHGRQGEEYVEERPEDPADAPMKATAAQMAKRKIKTAKGLRRPAGAASTSIGNAFAPSASTSSFNFGTGNAASTDNSNPFSQSQPAFSNNTSTGSVFGNAFGASTNTATSSFPPSQPSQPSNSFATASFPVFGTTNSNTGSAFNATPTFDFGSTATNFSGAPTAPATGTSTSSGGLFDKPSPQQPAMNIFNSQPSQQQSTPFGQSVPAPATSNAGTFSFLGAGATTTNGTTAPASDSVFSTTNNTPQNNVFGGFGTGASTPVSAAPASSNTGSIFTNFGANTAGNAATTTSSNPFSQFGANLQQGTTSTPSFGLSAQSQAPSVAAAVGHPFLYNPQSSEPALYTTHPAYAMNMPIYLPGIVNALPQPSTTMNPLGTSLGPFGQEPKKSTDGGFLTRNSGIQFGKEVPRSTLGEKTGNDTSTADASTNGEQNASGFATSAVGTQAKPSFTFGQSAVSSEGSKSTTASEPKQQQSSTTNFFSQYLAQSAESSQHEKAKEQPSTNMFGQSFTQSPELAATPAQKQPALSTSLFGQSTNKKTDSASEGEQKQQPSSSGNLFSQSTKPTGFSFTPEPKQQSTAANLFSQSLAKPSGLTSDSAQKEQQAPGGLFSQSVPKPSGFAPASEQKSQPPTNNFFSKSVANPPASASAPEPKQQATNFFSQPATNTTGSASSLFSTAPKSTTAPTSTVAPTSAASQKPTMPRIGRVRVPSAWVVSNSDTEELDVLADQLLAINESYRKNLADLPANADWSALSAWHSRETSSLMKKIDSIKKKMALAKGITGEESSLSTKRKAVEVSGDENQFGTPTKKSRSFETGTPETSAFSMTPKAPPPSSASAFFGSALSKKQEAPSSSPAASSVKTAETTNAGPAKIGAPQSGFKPSFGASAAPKQGGFKPSFTASTTAGGSSLFSQFGSQAKSKEQLRAERKAKAKREEWDSEDEDETEEQWEAKWEEQEAKREAAQAATQTTSSTGFTFKSTASKNESAPVFKFSAPSSEAASTPKDNSSGGSTPGLFGSRVSSPAPSATGARSVFETPSAAQSPASNIFSHLASGTSSQNQDSDDEAATDADEPQKSNEVDTADGESETSETLEESMRRKKPAGEARSLLDRITRDNSVASDKEESGASLGSNFFQQGNGTSTPKDKAPFKFFDFASAGAQSAPPKQSEFAGDQTFKPGTPIKFGTSTTTKSNTTFSFTPASPSPAESSTNASKAASSPFSFLAPKGASAASSVFTSRAATPASDVEASAGDSAVEGDEEQALEQLDNSVLTAEEREEHDVLYETEQAVAKKVVNGKWEQVGNGRLWILKHKSEGSVVVRMRMKNGRLPINHRILAGVDAVVSGKNKTMVTAPIPKDGKIESGLFAFKSTQASSSDAEKLAMTQKLADDFASVYNANK